MTVLETKLYIPRSRPELVSRPSLIERISKGVERKLTLVSAPAGFGKTTLLAEWLAQRADGRATGWVSLDASENEPAIFWTYFIRALQNIRSDVGQQTLAMLQAQSPPTVSVLTSLINDIDSIDQDVILVLDDYHVIDAPEIHTGLTFLLDHLPPRLHIIIASRTEPLLPLARMRARGEVTELRANDLRFTPDEASSFLNQVMALGLSADDIASLEKRTEGWIAGLKLAALSLKSHADVQRFIAAFSGDNRYIADYLIEEVLHSQPEEIRQFLLGTAILERLSASLCDAVMGTTGSQRLLESLEKSNLFVVPLDDRREWYRYHHLFAEVLHAHALREHPDRVREHHRRASAWYERNRSIGDAVRHAFGAEDLERVASLLEANWPAMDRSYETGKWLGRVKALPATLVRERPLLNMGFAWALLNAGELEAAEARLGEVEASVRALTDAGAGGGDSIVDSDNRVRALPREIATARVYLAQSRGDVAGTVEHARHALELVAEGDHPARAIAAALLGLAYWATGELEPAHQTFATALDSMRKAGQALDAIRGMFVLGDIRVAQGRLRDAARAYEAGLRTAQEHGGAPVTDELYFGLSELHRERGELETARNLLHTVEEQSARAEYAVKRHRWCTAMSRIAEARGDLAGALDLLHQAERVEVRDPVPRARPIAAMKARLWIAQDALDEARTWASNLGLRTDDKLSYMREFEHITLARLLIARGHAEGGDRYFKQSLSLLQRLEVAATSGGRNGSLIETLVLEALTHQALGDGRTALDVVSRALELAEPEGYLRVFVDEGVRMRDLLRQAVARAIAGAYTRQVLSAFDAPTPALATPDNGTAGARPVELLTARELEILRLVAAGLRNQEIADQLFISPATVKRHIANVYLKLDATHRTEALNRATALKLL